MTMLARIRLLQMTSQAFPIGGYSHSYGLEAAIESGCVRDEESVRQWIADVLTFSMGAYEIPLLCDMGDAWSAQDFPVLSRRNREFLASRESAELRSATVRMGLSMRKLLAVLPDLPEIPGFHTFWATTTNSRDTVQNRLRMGYTFLRSSDFPGWDAASIKTGEYAGVIGQNEMIAMKIRLAIWNLPPARESRVAPASAPPHSSARSARQEAAATRHRGAPTLHPRK